MLNCDFFIGIVGQRSGWKPDVSEIPEREEFDCLRSLPPSQSATSLEMHLALLTKSAAHCFFFIRSDDFLKGGSVPARHLPTFVDVDSQLKQLKEAICVSGAEVFEK